MFPIYMYVKEYKGLKDFEITFDNNYEIKYNRDKDTLSINKKCESTNNNIENFYSIDKTKGNIDSVNLLIGKNGSGKTSILEMLNLGVNETDLEEINCIVLYKSSINDEVFLLEKDGLSEFIKIKVPQEIKVIEEFFKYHEIQDKENYKKNIGIIKFSLKEKELTSSERENDSIFAQTEIVTYKANIGLENGSKKYIYDYLTKIKQEKNNDNFKNVYFTLLIPDLYFKLKNSNEAKIVMSFYKIDNDNEIFKLYDDTENDSLKDMILNNCFNYIYLIMVLGALEYCNEKNLSKEIFYEKKKKLLKLLIDKSPDEKFKILLKKFERLSKLFGESIKFGEDYKILEDNIAVIGKTIEKSNKIYIQDNKYIVNFKDSKQIIDLLKKYDDFHIPNFENKVALFFKEMEYIQIKEEGLSDGERIKLQYFSTIYGYLKGELKNKEYIIFLFDEVETYLHPEWSRRFLYELIEELEKYEDKKFKLIFATHSPFLIADVLAKDCIYLSKNKKGKIKAEIKEDVKTFGANIIDLFKNTMFLESTFGKFATEKIKEVVEKIDKAENYSQIKNNPEIDFIINEIGEKLISNKLKSMVESKFEGTKEEYFEEKIREYYDKKIKEYEAELKKLRNKEDKK